MPSAVTFLAGLAGVLLGGHLVVGAASRLGAAIGLSPMVIGLTIVAAGTSAPELAVVTRAILADDTELAVGSIVGSNIANVLLVLGLSATVGTIRVASRAVRVDIPIMIVASGAVLVMGLDGTLTRPEGLVLVVGLLGFVLWTFRAASGGDPAIPGVTPEPVAARPRAAIPAQVVALAAGIAVLAVTARLVVTGAEGIARFAGVPELVVGLTVVALGTSAPEIATTIIAVMKGRQDLAVGNAVGSNIFNLLLVLGATTLFAPDGIAISDDVVRLDLPIMAVAAVACLPIVYWDHALDRWEGAVFVAYYVAYVTFLVLDATGHRASDPFALVMVLFVMPLTVLTVAVGIVRQRRAARVRRSTGVGPGPVRGTPGGSASPDANDWRGIS